MTAAHEEAGHAGDSAAPAGTDPRSPICWQKLERDVATEQWQSLGVWVRWLVKRYALNPGTVPPCWYRHSYVIEELSALRTARDDAYSSAGSGQGPLDWHAALGAAKTRLEDAISRVGCATTAHHEDHVQGWLTDDDPHFANAIDRALDNGPPR